MEKTILIASASVDYQTYEPVISLLEQRGYSTVTYKTDKVFAGEDFFSMSVDDEGELKASYNGKSISPDAVCAAWYRKVSNFAIPNAADNVAKQLSVSNEVRCLHNTIWPLYPENKWLNAPDNMINADRKMKQLMVAKQVGFAIPHTVISSDWQEIERSLAPAGETIAVKMIKGVIADNNHLQAMYTSVLDVPTREKLKLYTVPFPGLYQPFIKKAREWRVTVVGDEVFPAAIYTSDEAKDDWRKLQETSAVVFKNEALPDDISEQCIAYLGKMGLKYGAFDLIEQPDGATIFLECNPNGQYGWLEDALGFSISHAIVSEILKIAQQ